MKPNPILKKLGLSDTDRVIIFHADDIGVCQASVDAYADLLDFGILSSAATMVPCAWFPATASLCRANQKQAHQNRENPSSAKVDMGVHLTLTCEQDLMRWGPITTRDCQSGLSDDEGYFHRTSALAQQYGQQDAVAYELEMQVERALQAGIDITHIDSHMGTLIHPKFWSIYTELAWRYRVPSFMCRWDAQALKGMGFDTEGAEERERLLQQAETAGMPALDKMFAMPIKKIPDRFGYMKSILSDLPAGITYFIIHPSRDTPELRAFTPDWQGRVADYELFTDPNMKEYMAQSGIHVIGYRVLREQMRNEM